ncbi:MAG: bifunctional demethylmenaquinone methyltransferase/2-methoxy-6-polyprenyl-1,4-benzoquinol methylase UbiE [Deltaproteobacteria bacterium]|nr:MAG: bifunctional demethylmenaquinone methyltransferase/2-methoxy-6-polyprenyl-1,4-benzoquinol methylase UbiE [Deltaproteobacteria bacterium]
MTNDKTLSDCDNASRANAIRDMFSAIAPRYDFLNRLLSLGIDRGWRRTLTRMALKNDTAAILDVACGTGDVSLALRRKAPAARIVGLDFSQAMLDLAAVKIEQEQAGIELVAASAEELPFPATDFDLLTIAFGIRNVVDKKKALGEFYRVLKPQGRLAVLEFSQPDYAWFRVPYNFYFFKILPLIGGLFVKRSAYRYLPDSVAKFPSRDEFVSWLKDAGFSNCRYHSLTFGIATLYLAEKLERGIVNG